MCKLNSLPYFFLITFSAFFCLFLSSLSPLMLHPHSDSAVFLAIARGMTEGGIPYVDFFDHKGPLLYFINYLGFEIGGLIGVWSIEIFCLFFSLLFSYKTANLFTSKYISLLAVFISYFILKFYFTEGNFTEEYALVFISISMYFFTKSFIEKKYFQKRNLIIHGACCMCVLLLRPNMIAVWAVFLSISFLRSLYEYKWNDAISFCLFFLCGLILPLLPTLFYLTHNNALYACIEQYIIFNSTSYISGDKFGHVIVNIIYYLKQPEIFLAMLIALITCYCKTSFDEKMYFFNIFLSLFLTILTMSLSPGQWAHYSMIILPLFVPIIANFINFLNFFCKKNVSQKCIFATKKLSYLLFIIINVAILYNIYDSRPRWMLLETAEKRYETCIDFVHKNTNQQDTFATIGFLPPVHIYIDRKSATKYIYMNAWLASLNKKNHSEFTQDILSKKPKIILVVKSQENNSRNFFTEIFQLISEEYVQQNINDANCEFIIFKRNDLLYE